MPTSLGTWIWTIVGAAGGGAAVAIALVRAFGARWLDSMFEGRLQTLRHEHERQMEDVRLEASRILDRSARLTEREFEVSAEAWSLVQDVYVQVTAALPGFRRYPDLSRASDDLVRHVVQDDGFDQFETAELLAKSSNERNSYYSDRKEAHQIWEGKKAVRDASNYLAKKALFMDKDVHEKLTAYADDAWAALRDWELARELRGHGPLPDNIHRHDEEFRKVAQPRIKELEQFMRERFWSRAR